MINLLEETLELIDIKDINYITINSSLMSIEDFILIARNTVYDDGYGCQYINPTLKIILNNDDWIERYEYDGSEGWNYFQANKKPKKSIKVNSLLME